MKMLFIKAISHMREMYSALEKATQPKSANPYKDSTQIGVTAVGTFTHKSWKGSTLPTMAGLTRVYKSFKPTKAILTELIVVTFDKEGFGPVKRAASIVNADDLVLVSAFAGADNCFPNAPNEHNGISGPAFANSSLGNGISWPTINGGIDMTIGFAVEPSAIYQITPPPGYTSDDITSIEVKARFNLLGPSLR